jgi:GGDEF domain-containing protein
VSIGVVACPQHGTDPERLLELADAAMYRAKASGERVEMADVDGPPAAAEDGRSEAP